MSRVQRGGPGQQRFNRGGLARGIVEATCYCSKRCGDNTDLGFGRLSTFGKSYIFLKLREFYILFPSEISGNFFPAALSARSSVRKFPFGNFSECLPTGKSLKAFPSERIPKRLCSRENVKKVFSETKCEIFLFPREKIRKNSLFPGNIAPSFHRSLTSIGSSKFVLPLANRAEATSSHARRKSEQVSLEDMRVRSSGSRGSSPTRNLMHAPALGLTERTSSATSEAGSG